MTGDHWLTRDHVLVAQAARNFETQPVYALQLWATANDPITASLQLVSLLMSERVATLVDAVAGPAYNDGYDEGYKDAKVETDE